ncbi:MAG: serine hydrolase [Balneolaceae bacterium]|nr:serine hydrolase [Balneolaceae bacterium]
MLSSVKRFAATTFILLFVITALQAQPDFQVVQDQLHDHISEGNILGGAVAYIYPDGRTRFISRGSLSPERDETVTKNTIFEIGSISKTFTALIMMKMAEEGVFSLDTPIETLLPDSLDIPSYEGEKIRLRHLATHTSGLPRLPTNMSPSDPLNPYADYTTKQMYEFLDGYNLNETPGSNYAYSNLGMGLLGHILELESKKNYEELLQEYITGPLLMDDTGISISDQSQPRFSAPYNYGNDAKYWDLPALSGAGAIRSTAQDMANYIKAQMGLMESPLESAIASTHSVQFDTGSGNTDAIGLGWFYSTGQDTILWHGGGTGGFRSFAGFNKEDNTGAVVLVNGTEDITNIGLHLLDNKHALSKVPATVSVDTARLETYTGTYKNENGLSFYVTRKGDQLWVQLSGQPSNRVYAKSTTRFFYKVVPAEIEFYPSKGDSAASLTLFQNGREIVAKKTSDEIIKPKREAIKIDPAVLDRYTGVYQLTPVFAITITKDGDQLMAQATGQQKLPIFPESKTKFFYKAVDAQIEFIANNKGAYHKLKLYQSGQILEGKRKEK